MTAAISNITWKANKLHIFTAIWTDCFQNHFFSNRRVNKNAKQSYQEINYSIVYIQLELYDVRQPKMAAHHNFQLYYIQPSVTSLFLCNFDWGLY